MQYLQPFSRVLLALLFFALGIWAHAGGLVDDAVYYWEDITYLVGEHIQLTLISASIAIVVAIPTGIWLSRPGMRRYSEKVMQVFNVGTTIPTLALLALAMSILGIGTLPAIFALAVATVLPIVRNTYSGLLAIPPHILEAATAIGMTPRQILWRVELPNAFYVMLAGIRTALAINIGTVPLAFLIGGGGLGELIFTGIDLDETGMMLSGAIPTALLAVAADFVMGVITYLFVPKGVNPLRLTRRS